jgi:hypothetical protein
MRRSYPEGESLSDQHPAPFWSDPDKSFIFRKFRGFSGLASHLLSKSGGRWTHKEETTMQAHLNENLINGVYGSGLNAYFFTEGDVPSNTEDDPCEPNGPCGPVQVPYPPD